MNRHLENKTTIFIYKESLDDCFNAEVKRIEKELGRELDWMDKLYLKVFGTTEDIRDIARFKEDILEFMPK